MNRMKQLAGALMLLVPLAACDEGTPPPPTGTIEGTVTIDGTGADGVTVALNDGTTTTTAGGGAYRFTGVEGGSYTVTISGYPSDASFDATQASAVIAKANDMVRVNFSGNYIRTSSIVGAVTVEGAGQSGVTVALSGMSDGTTTTSSDGAFAFTGLRAGTYTVEVSGFDSEAYSFSSTSQSATVAVGASARLAFEGTHIRTASIRGTVTVEDAGLSGVTVSLTGVSEATMTTDDAGAYAFTNLQAGSYTVTITGFNAREYGFDVQRLNATLDVGETANLNFEGTALRNGAVSGRLFVDELNKNNELDLNEAMLEVAGVMVVLTGPGVADTDTTTTDAQGMYGFDSLEAGNYRVTILHAAAAADTAVKLPSYLGYGGAANGELVELTASGSETVNFPFDIVTQTVKMKAMYGTHPDSTGEVAAGVKVDLYATLAASTAGAPKLGSGTTDAMGYVMFTFAREDDAGPGNLVYATAEAAANTALQNGPTLDITYNATSHEAEAENMFLVLSTQAVLEFTVVNRSNDGTMGGYPMVGWTAHVRKGTATAAPDTALTSAAKTGMVAVTYTGVERGDKYYIRLPGGSAEIADSVESQDTTLTKGESFKLTVTPGDDGAKMDVALDKDAKTAATPFLVYTHTGMELPGTKMDLGKVEVTFTTQTLVVGVHHERDNILGFSNIARAGDTRPAAADIAGPKAVKVGLYEPNPIRPNLTELLLDEDGEEMEPAAVTSTGLITWKGLDSDLQLSLEAETGQDKIIIWHSRLNVFGKDVDVETTGTTGAFGEKGGLMPVVYFCPQTTTDPGLPAYSQDCSTFAYKFQDGSINVEALSETYAEGDSVVAQGIVVTATAVPGQLNTISGKPDTTSADGTARIANLVDGDYILTISETATWKPKQAVDTLTVLGGADAATYNLNDAAETQRKRMTYKQTKIQGTVANDRDGSGTDDVVEDGETREGVTVQLATGTPTTRGARVVATTTTNSDGEYEFTVDEGRYYVWGPSGADYVLCFAQGEPCSGTRAASSGAVTTTALVAGRTIARTTQLPTWNVWTADSQNPYNVEADTDFAIVFRTSRLSGHVGLDSVARAVRDTTDYVGVRVSAFRCTAVDATNTDTPDNRCTAFASGAPATAVTDTAGNWSMTGLLEGIYRIQIDTRAGETAIPTRLETSNASRNRAPLEGENARRGGLNFVVQN